MKDLYQVAGVSKQALHQSVKATIKRQLQQHKIFEAAKAIRKEHPAAGCRKMALDLRSKGWSRDKIEQLLLRAGYRVYHKPNYLKTTHRQHRYHCANLIEGLELNGINQVIQTDITYYRVAGRFYYLTFIIDVYSKVIGGYSVNRTLHADGNIKALKMFIARRGHLGLSKMIHHSDKGSQYIDAEYVNLIKENNITMSMSDQAWQNAYSERINRTIKEEYLDGWRIKSYAQLKIAVQRAVTHYNSKRRHQNLQWESPFTFEKNVQLLKQKNRPIITIYKQEVSK